jgi:hypothetical protein
MVTAAASTSTLAAAWQPDNQRADSLTSMARPRRDATRVRRPRPDLRINQPNHRLALDIDGDDRMDEEAGCLTVASRPKAAPLPVATGKIDLGSVLHRQNPAARTLRRRPPRQGLDDPLDRDVGRRQKPMHRLLSSPGLPKLAQHQRPRRRHPLDQPIGTLCNPYVAK